MPKKPKKRGKGRPAAVRDESLANLIKSAIFCGWTIKRMAKEFKLSPMTLRKLYGEEIKTSFSQTELIVGASLLQLATGKLVPPAVKLNAIKFYLATKHKWVEGREGEEDNQKFVFEFRETKPGERIKLAGSDED